MFDDLGTRQVWAAVVYKLSWLAAEQAARFSDAKIEEYAVRLKRGTATMESVVAEIEALAD